MDGSEKQVCWIVAFIVFGVIVIASLLTIYETSVDTAAINNGYSETTLPGISGTRWTKGQSGAVANSQPTPAGSTLETSAVR